MNVVVDSSAFVSSFVPADRNHRHSRAFFDYLQRSSLEYRVILPRMVPLEVGNVLLRRGIFTDEFDDYREFQDYFEQYHLLDLDKASARQLLPFFVSLSLRTSDAIIAATAALHQAKLISWDAQLNAQASNLVEAITPKEFLKEL